MTKLPLRLVALAMILSACGPSQEATLTGPEFFPSPDAAAPAARPRPFDPNALVRPSLQTNLPPDRVDLSREIAETLRTVEGIKAVARVGLDVVDTRASAGGNADITVIAVDPEEFRPLAPSTTANADFVWRGLRGRQVFLAHEEYRRLGVQPGQNIHLRGPGSSQLFRIGGVAANGVPNFAGALISFQHAAALGLAPPRTLLAGLSDGEDVTTVLKRIAGRMPFRFDKTAATSNRAFFTGNAAATLFGAFDYTVNPDGSINPTPEWVKKYIVAKTVPILGSTRCHRLMFPQLEGALKEIEAEGLTSIINVKDYGGCYNARLIRGEDPNDPASHKHLSMHAWGLAVDINVSTNQMGAQPTLDPRIVEIFERWGYRWGGRWSRPDGMHFELAAILKELAPTRRPRRR
jgi:hypothetical protein